MSNDRQETIADIVTKMLEFAETDSQTIGRDVLRRRIQHFVASIIEAAMKRERKAGAEAAQICGEVGEMVGREAACRQPVTDCHVLGNAGGNPRMKALCERAHNIMHNAAAKREREAGAAAAHQLEVAELRECLKEAVTEVCNRLEKCGFKEPCVFKTCYVQKWRKALRKEGGAK